MNVFNLVSQGQRFTLIILYIIQFLCVCVSARESLLFPKTCPKRINRVKLSVVESGYVCLLSEESLCEVLARWASLAGGDRGDLFSCIPA